MTIVSILIAFSLCHFIREMRHLRRFEWVTSFTGQCNDKLKKLPGWSGPTGFFVILGLPLLAIYLINSLMFSALGPLGHFIFAIAILIYTFGPRDLDIDVRAVFQADNDEKQKEAFEALLDEPIPENKEQCETAAIHAVFSKALKRWFGIIFWFAVLGVYGALLFRMAVWLTDEDFGLYDEQKELFTSLSKIMQWPVAQLMTLSLAIATDFDCVFRAWRHYHINKGHGLFEGNNEFMLISAYTMVKSGHAAQDGYADRLHGPMASIKLSMDLVWRSLGVWATVLAILLLVNVIA
jgi:AmpE protein